MNTIIGELGKNQKFCEILNNLENKKGPIAISGLIDVGKVQMIAAINSYINKPICIITYNELQAKKMLEDLKYFTENAVFFPKKDILTYDYIAESKELFNQRIEVLNNIYENKNIILVTTIEALIQKMISKNSLYKNILEFKVGKTYDLEEIKQKLINLGYARCELIEGKGQFSIRGGIVDISIDESIGVRIEFWGDEIDSIRYFNISSQRSTSNIKNINIYPSHEYILEKDIKDICDKIQEKIYSQKQQEIVNKDIEIIQNGD